MSIRPATSLRRRQRAITELHYLYSHAGHFRQPHDDVLAGLAKIREVTLKGVPRHVMGYFNGYAACLAHKIYDVLVYGGICEDGKFYSSHSSRDDYYDKHGIAASDWADDGKVKAKGHYWAHGLPDDPRPFFVYKDEPKEGSEPPGVASPVVATLHRGNTGG